MSSLEETSAANNVVEQIEKNKVKMTFKVGSTEVREGLKYAYNRNRNRIVVDGFRKGKAPRKVIERLYGKDIFHDEAVNHILPDAYESALDELGLEPVYKPDIHVDSFDEDTGAVFIAEFYVKPEVEIDAYYGLNYPIMQTEPTEDDIQNRLRAEQEKNSRMVTVERPAQDGDVVTINYTGYIDGEPFEGGHGEEHDLTLGSKSFIDNFEEQLVGHAEGDDVEVNVTFPEEYHHDEYRGKAALFKVEVLEVQSKELPELNDEFAQDVSEFDTLAEYRDSLKESIRKDKEEEATMAKRTTIVEQLVDKAVMDVPEVMYTSRIDEMVEEMRYRLQMQGLPLESFMQFSGLTMERLREDYERPAREDVNATLVLETIAKKENLEVSDEEFQEHIEKIATDTHQNADDLMERLSQRRKDELKQELLNQKALDFVVEKAVAIDSPL